MNEETKNGKESSSGVDKGYLNDFFVPSLRTFQAIGHPVFIMDREAIDRQQFAFVSELAPQTDRNLRQAKGLLVRGAERIPAAAILEAKTAHDFLEPFLRRNHHLPAIVPEGPGAPA